MTRISKKVENIGDEGVRYNLPNPFFNDNIFLEKAKLLRYFRDLREDQK